MCRQECGVEGWALLHELWGSGARAQVGGVLSGAMGMEEQACGAVGAGHRGACEHNQDHPGHPGLGGNKAAVGMGRSCMSLLEGTNWGLIPWKGSRRQLWGDFCR